MLGVREGVVLEILFFLFLFLYFPENMCYYKQEKSD